MIGTPFPRIGGWSAYASAAATILGFAFIGLFFTFGQPFGTLNDFFGGLLLALSLMPVAVALYLTLRPGAPGLSLLGLVVGLGSAVVFAIASGSVILKTFGVLAFPEPRPGTGPWGAGMYAPGFIGLWLVLVGITALAQSAMPALLGWLGVIAGAGYVPRVAGFARAGPNHPLVVVAGLAAAITYPIWAIWLGRLLVSGSLPMGRGP